MFIDKLLVYTKEKKKDNMCKSLFGDFKTIPRGKKDGKKECCQLKRRQSLFGDLCANQQCMCAC